LKIRSGFIRGARVFARFRSRTRDKETDLARVSAIRTATRSALAEAKSEAAGLERRIEEVRASLAFSLGDEDGSYFEREAENETEIASLEGQLLKAERRVRDLELHVRKLAEIDRLLDEMTGEASAPRESG
jgi:predicted  nucleic acid-binding Zn-ribbon protein